MSQRGAQWMEHMLCSCRSKPPNAEPGVSSMSTADGTQRRVTKVDHGNNSEKNDSYCKVRGKRK